MGGSNDTQAPLVDGEDFGGIIIGTGHVVHVPNRPPVVGVVGGCVGMGQGLDTAEKRQAPVPGHSGQVEPQLVQEVTRPEEIGMGSLWTMGPFRLQLPEKMRTRGRL